MPEFIFAYHGGKPPENDADMEKTMADWRSWFEGMGNAVVNPGNPVGMSKTVSSTGVSDDGGANPVSGYSIVMADSIQSAVRMARDCPMVKDGSGSVEVAEIHEM
ncbi:hypothetical protein [Roseobacter ponti]|uniref:YCII-related domain-containing protein n=1 Tax=Roseobacter ponti TaxID=1891787 RepID=A0A858SYS2_9RHOB|nr:hypothetical protein [Roseobacter ponti]QJF53022.1 hypothetical protein G3256_18470 [Roseobacter ponti]